jgi:hypothetical protein
MAVGAGSLSWKALHPGDLQQDLHTCPSHESLSGHCDSSAHLGVPCVFSSSHQGQTRLINWLIIVCDKARKDLTGFDAGHVSIPRELHSACEALFRQ